MSNDVDPNGQALTFVSAQGAIVGTVVSASGNVVFTAPIDFTGSATFTYTIQNTAGLQATGTVLLEVRMPAPLPIYAVTMDSKLYTYDAVSGTVVYLTTLTLNGRPFSGSGCIGGAICEIAITPNGVMYAVDGSSLYNVNPVTGVMTKVQVHLNGAYELSSTASGQLIISSDTASVIFDPPTNSLSELPLEKWIEEGGGDAILLPNQNLYMTIYERTGPDHLLMIDPDTGAEIDLGSVGFKEVWGLGYAQGILYGFTGEGYVFTINQATGASKLIQTLSEQWASATTNPALW